MHFVKELTELQPPHELHANEEVEEAPTEAELHWPSEEDVRRAREPLAGEEREPGELQENEDEDEVSGTGRVRTDSEK